MFEITLNGKTIYHPNSKECSLLSAKILEKLNDAGYLDMKVPYNNPLYDELIERNGRIIVYKDNIERWYGDVRDIDTDFNKNKSVYVVGEMAELNDSVQPQREIKGTKYEVLTEILRQHNSMVEDYKKFYPGVISHNANKAIRIITNWEYSLDAIRGHLCEDEEYIKIRHVEGRKYIDILPLETYGKRSNQTIRFAENLLDYAEESSGTDIATVCIPLGRTQEEEAIEGYENYLTCEAANGGKNYIELPTAVDRIGRITKVVHFNVLNTPEALVTAAVNWLKTAQYAKLKLKLNAVDLSVLHAEIDEYSIGDYIHAICEPMGMDAWFPVRSRETDLFDISRNKIEVGSEGSKSLTSQQNSRIEILEKNMPDKESMLNTALRNAAQLFNSNGERGNVSLRLDKNLEPYEIVVMDDDSLEKSTRAWRWNLSGFGHGTKEAGESEFKWSPNVAMTMDGEIIATKGSICGFNINMIEVITGLFENALYQANESGSIKIYFNEQSGTSGIAMIQKLPDGTTRSSGITPGTVITQDISADNVYQGNVNLKNYIDGVNNLAVNRANALSERCDLLSERCDTLYNLIKAYHP